MGLRADNQYPKTSQGVRVQMCKFGCHIFISVDMNFIKIDRLEGMSRISTINAQSTSTINDGTY